MRKDIVALAVVLLAVVLFVGLHRDAGPPVVVIETERGTLTLELYPDAAPNTVHNFLGLVQNGFYDGLKFHRVIPGFMIQGGCPVGDGTGGPGYRIPCELNDRKHVRGTLAMANAGKDTGGSQFFICHAPQPHLDRQFTVFGQLIDGLEVLDKIQQGDVMRRVRQVSGSPASSLPALRKVRTKP